MWHTLTNNPAHQKSETPGDAKDGASSKKSGETSSEAKKDSDKKTPGSGST